ncbi:MAG: glutamate synthase [Clostridiales bacterium]|jgi:glutamate synthase domain-containing protein 3|nr:glutamate synthase [Clostridiales bacterium]
MTIIDARGKHFRDLNREIKDAGDAEILVQNCNGQRYIGAGVDNAVIKINGVPGNALGAYLNNCEIHVNGNAQDATGDTMNGGKIIIHGNSGDATGYAMRGGVIYISGNVGYRAGVHIKSYGEFKPVIIIGGKTGNFLAEYQAGGMIVLLNLGKLQNPAGDFIANGMHGGEIYIRNADADALRLSDRLVYGEAAKSDLDEISKNIEEYCGIFGLDYKEIMSGRFIRITPNTLSPYKQLYVNN